MTDRTMAEEAGDYLALDEQQAAALFRLHVDHALGGCQFEHGRMRWWLRGGLRIELAAGGWRLYVVPTRRCSVDG